MKRILILALVAAALVSGIGLFLYHKASQPVETSTDSPARPALSSAELEALKSKAEGGDAGAQIRLGWVYQEGDGVKRDMKAAVKWFQKAADQNNPAALAALGEMYQAGQGVPSDLTNAARLYRQAADMGSVAGQYNLAYLCEQGTGVAQSETEAAKWYQLAAEGGDPLAQYAIGQRYMLGLGVNTNLAEGMKWLMLAARQGQADSGRALEKWQASASADEVAKAGEMAQKFVPRKANAGANGTTQ